MSLPSHLEREVRDLTRFARHLKTWDKQRLVDVLIPCLLRRVGDRVRSEVRHDEPVYTYERFIEEVDLIEETKRRAK